VRIYLYRHFGVSGFRAPQDRFDIGLLVTSSQHFLAATMVICPARVRPDLVFHIPPPGAGPAFHKFS